MRPLVLISLILLGLVPNAHAADRSWAEPQIETVVEAGLLADSAEAFKPQKPLTQRALGAALETLSFASAEPVVYRYPVAVPGRAVTIRELDGALVGFLGLGDSARLVTAALRDAGLAPKAGAGTETVARLLGLRVNHPAAEDALELGLNDVATRAEAAYSLARVLALSGFEQEQIRTATAAARPPRAGRDAAATAPPGGLADRLAVRLGRHVGVAAAALGRKAAPGRLRLLRPRLARLQAGAVRGCLRARDGAPRPHHLRDVGRGAAGPADQEDREPAARRRHLPGREGAGVEARAGRPRWHLPRRRLVHPLVRKRHHPPPPRRVVPRPVRLGAQAVARGRAQSRYPGGGSRPRARSSNGS